MAAARREQSEEPVGPCAFDESPLWVRDLAGSVRDWCEGWVVEGPTPHVGGSYGTSIAALFHIDAVQGLPPDAVGGVRVPARGAERWAKGRIEVATQRRCCTRTDLQAGVFGAVKVAAGSRYAPPFLWRRTGAAFPRVPVGIDLQSFEDAIMPPIQPRCPSLSSATLLTICLLTATLSAQRTWIVDAAGGPGVDFTDLPPAFAAVRDGDRVVVRRGSYGPARLDKAVQVVGEAGATVESMSLLGPPLEVTGIAAGRTCVLLGLAFRGTWRGPALQVRANAGLVVLADLAIEGLASPGLDVADCQAVAIANSLVRPDLTVTHSTISAAGCTFRAYHEGEPGGRMAVAIVATRATVELAQCTASGSDSTVLHAPSTPAIMAESTTLLLRGDAASRYTGGTLIGHPPSPSIDGRGSSTLVVDPAIALTPAPVNLVSIAPRRMGSLTARGGAVGSTLDLELYSPAGDLHALFAALPVPPFAIPRFGVQWMDLASEVLLVVGVQGGTEHTTFSFGRGSDPALRGLALTFQALSGPSLQTLALSNPAIPVLP